MVTMVLRNGAVDKAMTEEINARALIGGNQPPTPFDALKAHIDDLDMEARNQLDGKPIENEAQAETVAKLLDDARKASKEADEKRADEKRPHDEAGKTVQAKWKPLIDQADTITSTAKAAQTAWLIKKDNEKRAAVEAANQEAQRLAAAARDAAAKAAPDDLAGQTTARVRQEAATAAAKQAERLDKTPVQVRGGSRATALRSVWITTLSDAPAALKHYRERQPDELKAWLLSQAERDVRAGARSIPGFEIKEEKAAV